MSTGLYLGKFAPLHKGHQYVIETALDEVDELILLIYDVPETANTPLTIRAKWLRELYPQTEVVEAWTGPTKTGYTEEMKRKHQEYVIDRLGGRNITHFYSSEPYGEHMSEALNAVDRRIDPERETVPISSTQIRDDAYENRKYIDSVVYRDLVKNVVFLGGPSTGKTTIAKVMAEHYDTEWMEEYGREYWEENNVNRRLSMDQLEEIAEGHIERENERLLDSDSFLFTDTNAITTLCFSKYYHNDYTERLWELARNCAFRYDYVFVCGMDIDYDDTWDRSGPDNRERLQKMTISLLDEFNISYTKLTGSVEQRRRQVIETLEE